MPHVRNALDLPAGVTRPVILDPECAACSGYVPTDHVVENGSRYCDETCADNHAIEQHATLTASPNA